MRIYPDSRSEPYSQCSREIRGKLRIATTGAQRLAPSLAASIDMALTYLSHLRSAGVDLRGTGN